MDDLRDIANRMKIEELAISVEGQIFHHRQRIAEAYQRLVNAKVDKLTFNEVKDAKNEMIWAGRDLHKFIITELANRNLSKQDMLSVNDKLMRQDLNNYFVAVSHYTDIFMYASNNEDGSLNVERKLDNLATCAYLVRDFIQAAESIDIDDYFKEYAPH